MNATLKIPNETVEFYDVGRASEAVRRFMEAAEEEKDAMVVQAGVWALTEGYSREEIQAGASEPDLWVRQRSGNFRWLN